MRFLKPGSLSIFAVSRFSTAISGSSPTSDRVRSGIICPSTLS